MKNEIHAIVFSVDEVAKMLACSTRTVARYCDEGLMTFRQVKENGRLMFTADDVNEFLETARRENKDE